MAISGQLSTARITGHNGVENELIYSDYADAAARAHRAAVADMSLEIPFSKKLAAQKEREYTLALLGRGESIAPTE